MREKFEPQFTPEEDKREKGESSETIEDYEKYEKEIESFDWSKNIKGKIGEHGFLSPKVKNRGFFGPEVDESDNFAAKEVSWGEHQYQTEYVFQALALQNNKMEDYLKLVVFRNEHNDWDKKKLNTLSQEYIKSKGIIDGQTILEIGGRLVEDLRGFSDSVEAIGYQKGGYHHVDSSDRITLKNFEDFFKDQKANVTTSRFVFDIGSGIEYGGKSNGECAGELMSVYSNLTKKGGFSVHFNNALTPRANNMDDEVVSYYKLLSENGFVHIQGSRGVAGFDLYKKINDRAISEEDFTRYAEKVNKLLDELKIVDKIPESYRNKRRVEIPLELGQFIRAANRNDIRMWDSQEQYEDMNRKIIENALDANQSDVAEQIIRTIGKFDKESKLEEEYKERIEELKETIKEA